MNRQQTHAETSAGAVHAILVHSMKISQVLKDKNEAQRFLQYHFTKILKLNTRPSNKSKSPLRKPEYTEKAKAKERFTKTKLPFY